MFTVKTDIHKNFESLNSKINPEFRYYSSLYGNEIGMLYGRVDPHNARAHQHNLYQLTILPSEDAHVECSWLENEIRKTIELRGSHIFYIAKNIPHNINILSKSEVFHIYLTETFIEKTESQFFWNNVMIEKWWNVIKADFFMWDLQMKLLEGFRSRNRKNSQQLLALVVVYAEYLLRTKICPINNSAGSCLSSPQIRKIIEFIGTNLSEKITVADMADQIGMKKHHFSYIFKRSMGISPKQYLLAVRLYYAQKLIREEKLSFAEIAAESGFFDQSHMLRSLKNYCVMSEASLFANLYREEGTDPTQEGNILI